MIIEKKSSEDNIFEKGRNFAQLYLIFKHTLLRRIIEVHYLFLVQYFSPKTTQPSDPIHIIGQLPSKMMRSSCLLRRPFLPSCLPASSCIFQRSTLPTCLSCLPARQGTCLPAYPPARMSDCIPACLPACLVAHLPTCLVAHVPVRQGSCLLSHLSAYLVTSLRAMAPTGAPSPDAPAFPTGAPT